MIVSLRWGGDDVSVYLAGSVSRDEVVFGLSDLDLVAVAPRDAFVSGRGRRHLGRRLRYVRRAVPALRRLAPDVEVCEEHELQRAAADTVLTHGLKDPSSPANLLADTGWSRVALLQERPGIGRPLDTWRLMAGPERRPTALPPDADRDRIAAWLELQFWWRLAFDACLNPLALSTAYLCVKLVSEPVRAWLWLEHGEVVVGRRKALLRGLRALPEEEPAIRRALELEASLNRSPNAPVRDAISLLTRLTTRVAGNLAAAAGEAGVTDVRLVGTGQQLSLPAGAPPQGVVPLADWRAIVAPRIPDEGLVVRAGDPADPAAVADAAMAARPGVVSALQRGPLLVMPTRLAFVEGMMRAVQCPVSDPVTHALVAGRDTAAFPRLLGWSACDVARRAVAEHAAWLRHPGPPPRSYLAVDAPQPVTAVARLLTATRASIFATSLERGEPALALTAAATASLAENDRLAQAIGDAHHALTDWHRERRPCASSTVANLRKAVSQLDPYRSPKPERSAGGAGCAVG